MFFEAGLFLAQSAAPAAEPNGMNSMVGFFGPLLIIGVMIFFMFRSQRKEAKKREEMLSTIKTGDKVLTAGGIYGVVSNVKDKGFVIKIADNVKIEVIKTGVSAVIDKEEGK
ncbi:MAG: preprotein translocase subunit YajC [Lentisphaerae bacterium GWF2_52_8]|nr:MAG: preprotein translocase subunit YajC [Lentisphaerae bacterium GWF2_52_8]